MIYVAKYYYFTSLQAVSKLILKEVETSYTTRSLKKMSTPSNTSTQSERRTHNRITFNAEILMQCGNEEWSCNLLDISLKGMLVEPPQNLDINLDNPCGMALFLGEDIAIHARVNIIRSNGNNWGLKWLQIDSNSMQHLRRLIELNTSNPAMLMRELSELG